MSEAGDAQKIDITSSTIFRVILIAIGFWFLYVVVDLLVMLFAAVVIASAIKPVGNWLQAYRVPRALSVLLVYALVLIVFSGVVTLMIPPLTAQLTQFAHALPQLLPRFDARGIINPPPHHQPS